MRRGCVSLGNIRCDQCRRVIQHSQRYLVIEEPDAADESTQQAAFRWILRVVRAGNEGINASARNVIANSNLTRIVSSAIALASSSKAVNTICQVHLDTFFPIS